MIQPSASNTDLLLQCGRPFGEETLTENISGDAALYGTAFHSAFIMGDWAPAVALGANAHARVMAHRERAWTMFGAWLARNMFDVDFTQPDTQTEREVPLAFRMYRLGVVQRRTTTLEVETHTYDLRPGEMGGTFDFFFAHAPSGLRVVLDVKTGADRANIYLHPSALGQMRTLAVATEATHVAVLHTPETGPDVIYVDPITLDERRGHAKRLRLAMARAGDGSMRPGPACKYCPARKGCPAKDSDLVRDATALVSTVAQPLARGDIDLGRAHMLLAEFEHLSKRAREIIRQAVEDGEVVERPDGKVLRFEDRAPELLSKKSVLEALGAVEGEKMLDVLRKKGCITKTPRKELHAR